MPPKLGMDTWNKAILEAKKLEDFNICNIFTLQTSIPKASIIQLNGRSKEKVALGIKIISSF